MSQAVKALWGSAAVLGISVTVLAGTALYVAYDRMTDALGQAISAGVLVWVQ